VHGFVCESQALQNARDITRHGGWRAYLRSLGAPLAA
jgi:allophanate hydrolase